METVGLIIYCIPLLGVGIPDIFISTCVFNVHIFIPYRVIVRSQYKYVTNRQAVMDFHYGLMVRAFTSRLLGKSQSLFYHSSSSQCRLQSLKLQRLSTWWSVDSIQHSKTLWFTVLRSFIFVFYMYLFLCRCCKMLNIVFL